MMDNLPQIRVSFFLIGSHTNLDEFTEKMQLTPDLVRTKESFPISALAYDIWSLRIRTSNCKSLSEVFEKMIVRLAGKESIILEICNEYQMNAGFEVVIHMESGDGPEIVLSKECVSFAASINAEIGFDIYCYE